MLHLRFHVCHRPLGSQFWGSDVCILKVLLGLRNECLSESESQIKPTVELDPRAATIETQVLNQETWSVSLQLCTTSRGAAAGCGELPGKMWSWIRQLRIIPGSAQLMSSQLWKAKGICAPSRHLGSEKRKCICISYKYILCYYYY